METRQVTDAGNLKVRIHTFLAEKFPLVRSRGITNQDPLLESGILDSLGVLDLVGFAETEFGIQVNDDELLPENFQTIDSLAAYIVAKQGRG